MPVVTFPDAALLAEVGPVPGVDGVVWDLTGEPARRDEVTAVVAPYLGGGASLDALRVLPRLDLVQLQSAGYDGVLQRLPPGVRVANAAGVHDASTAELAVGLVIAALRGFPEAVRAQQEGRWAPLGSRRSLADRRVLLVGYGSIGHAIARRLDPFEVELSAVATHARAGDDLVGHIHGGDELPRLLPHHDVVIVVVPLTEDTTRLVDDTFLAAMPDGAVLVNVSRGAVADTEALARHAGRLLVAVDVTDPEPLPEDHPLWRAGGTLITPHVGGDTTAMRPRVVRLLREQLHRYAAGRPLLNVVHEGGSSDGHRARTRG